MFSHVYVTVSELMGRVRNVILMNVYLGLENPRGSGFRVGGYMSQMREMGKSVYEQPENEVDGSCHKQGGFQVSGEGLNRGARGE